MFLPKANRKIIPRLRPFSTTTILGQLNPADVAGANHVELSDASHIEALAAWQRDPSLWHAMDLVGAAFVIGDVTNNEVVSAAKVLYANKGACPTPVRDVAVKILESGHLVTPVVESTPVSPRELRTQIRSRRHRLSGEPRNAILWADVACLYTSLGQAEQAKRAMEIACHLAPDNRFVVRSAARFLVHIGENDQALKLLRKSAIAESDPWVVAAEIGISTFSNSNPRFLKRGRGMVERPDLTDFAKSELASAIATIEINEGNRRAAKKLFRRSLILPTENSAAQAEWASAQVGELDIGPTQLNIPLNYEAKAVHGYRTSHWEMALQNAGKWLNDQPFSSRPAQLASYLYNLLDQNERAYDVLSASLALNPNDRGLINNMAFTLIELGHLDEAAARLKEINPTQIDDWAAVSLTATKGMLMFRTGFPEAGRQMYQDAIQLAKRKHNDHYAALAAIYLAFEELRADQVTKLERVAEAQELAARNDEPDIRFLSQRLCSLVSGPCKPK